PVRGRRRRRHHRPAAARAPGAAVRADRGPPTGHDDHPAHQLRLQVRDPARGRSRLRHAVHPEPVLRARAARAVGSHGAGARLRPRPARRIRVPRPHRPAARVQHPGVRRRGQEPAHRWHRLHRRAAPLDRLRRGAGAPAARGGPRARRGLPPRARAQVRFRRWLEPGIGVKRWLLLMFVGLLLLALGVAHVLRQLSVGLEPGSTIQTIVDLVTLQFLPFWLRGALFGGLGAALFLYGAWRLAQALTEPLRMDEERPIADVIYQKRFLARGPRIVAIGGGTGLSTLLRGLKEHTSNLTAIVTVADDGGSSGALRDQLGIPPVGDIRNCIAALADAEPLMADLLGYRFPGFERAESGLVETTPGSLAGHAVGNLLLAAMTALE